MKRPCSSGQTLEDMLLPDSKPSVSISKQQLASSEPWSKREKKQQSYTLCNVCNIQLNSSAQAKIHYNGKSHQKRLKHISSAKPHNSSGSPTQSRPLLTSLPIAGRPLQQQMDLKHFLPFRLNGSSPLSLFPNFNSMDPVQKAVINHTFGVPQPLRKKQIISCNICHLRFNSTSQAEAHYKGHKHARKLKAMESQKNKQRNNSVPPESEKPRTGEAIPLMVDRSLGQDPIAELMKEEEAHGSSVMFTPSLETSSMELIVLASPQVSPASQVSESTSDSSNLQAAASNNESTAQEVPQSDTEPSTEGNKDPKKTKSHLHCPVCNVTVNSVSQLDAHNSGSKHKLMLEGQSVLPRRRGKVASGRGSCKTKRLGVKGTIGITKKAFQCEVCEIYVNSETQLKQHMNSRRHKDRLAGKPPKPKFSPYSKSQQNSLLTNVSWNGYTGGALSAMKKVFSHCTLTSPLAQTKLALQKLMTKSLTATFLPTPLNPTALCTMASNPLALRHPAGTATLIQAPLLSPALFRPAPGPLRATHTPIIFSPY